MLFFFFFFQAEDGIRDGTVTGVQTCALPISSTGRPKGVSATLAGLPVLAAEANQKVSAHWRRVLTLVVGLLGVALVLLATFRNAQRALVPLIPIVLASGWSALVLFLIRIPLNPMSV